MPTDALKLSKHNRSSGSTQIVVENSSNENLFKRTVTESFTTRITANVLQLGPILIMIAISNDSLATTVLLDTGPSQLVISKVFFEQLKHIIIIRHLSRQVKIITANSTVKFFS